MKCKIWDFYCATRVFTLEFENPVNYAEACSEFPKITGLKTIVANMILGRNK